MSLSFSSRDRRTLSLGTAVILGMLTVGKGIPAVRDWESERLTSAARAQRQVRLLEGGARVVRQLQDSVRAREQRLASLRRLLIDAPRQSDGGPMLSSLISAVADDTDVEVLTMNVHADSAANPLRRVDVRMNGQGDIAGVMRFLRAVEDTTALLSVRELTVSQSDPGAPDNRSEVLRFEVVIQSLTRPGHSERPGEAR